MSTFPDFHFDPWNERPPVAKAVRTYRCGKQFGLVYEVEGQRRATLFPRKHSDPPRPSRILAALGYTPASGTFVDHQGVERRSSTGRKK